MSQEFPFNAEIPKGYSLPFGEAITRLRLETKFEDRGIDFTPIIEGMQHGKVADVILENHPQARDPKTQAKEPPEKIRNRLDKKEKWGDLEQFFSEKKNRKYFVLIDRFQHPDKPLEERRDFLFVTEPTADGNTALFIFEYPEDTYFYGEDKQTPFLRLRLAANILSKDEQKVIYYDNGDIGNSIIGILSKNADTDAIIKGKRILFKDPLKSNSEMEVEGLSKKLKIPTPDIIQTTDWLLHMNQHIADFQAFRLEFAPANISQMLQDRDNLESHMATLLENHPSVMEIYKYLYDPEFPERAIADFRDILPEIIPNYDLIKKMSAIQQNPLTYN